MSHYYDDLYGLQGNPSGEKPNLAHQPADHKKSSFEEFSRGNQHPYINQHRWWNTSRGRCWSIWINAFAFGLVGLRLWTESRGKRPSAFKDTPAKLADLREQEQRLTVELSSIAEKTAIMKEWQNAIEILKVQDITTCLFSLAEQKPVAFRRLLSLVFEPNSPRVRTERATGRQWIGVLEDYKLTETVQNERLSFLTKP